MTITREPGENPGRADRVAGPRASVGPADALEPLLTIDSISRRFGGVIALSDLSFAVASGEKLAVIGPNGAGKSTLLKLIAGQDSPSSGEIRLRGAGVVSGHSPRELARHGVALARQIPRPLRSLTVRQNVAVGIDAGRDRREVTGSQRIEEILEITALASKANRQAGQLPLLDLKRLEVARALACEPRVLLLDEVSAGLSESDLHEAIALMADLNAGGTTLVIVEHVQEVIRRLADRVIVLNWGKLLAEGSPAAVAADERVQDVYLGSGRAAVVPRPARARPASGGELSLRNVTVRRGMHRAIDDVSLTVPGGTTVTVLGANGAGKSSLAQSISGLLFAQSGVIEWNGRDITREAAHVRARSGIAHCQEGRKLFAGLTVQENLELGGFGLASADRRSRAIAMYELFPVLAERRTQIAMTMSGGQQQMLALARALMSRPKLLVLDEVTLGLSPKVADEIYGAIGAIAAEGTSLLLIEQDTDRSMSIADHVCVLSHGRVVFDGKPEALTERDLLVAYLGEHAVEDGQQPLSVEERNTATWRRR